MKKVTGLGRGLDALIDTTHVEPSGGSSINEVELSKIVANPNQPRRNFDQEALDELADSIREHGVISPITLRKNDDGTYMIIAGERRFRAAKEAGLKEVPVIIRDYSGQQAAEAVCCGFHGDVNSIAALQAVPDFHIIAVADTGLYIGGFQLAALIHRVDKGLVVEVKTQGSLPQDDHIGGFLFRDCYRYLHARVYAFRHIHIGSGCVVGDRAGRGGNVVD